MKVPLEVGQIRDVRSPRDRIQKKTRLVRVASTATPLGYPEGYVTVANLDDRQECQMNAAVLERCPVVDENGNPMSPKPYPCWVRGAAANMVGPCPLCGAPLEKHPKMESP